jgi:hypothetical protein
MQAGEVPLSIILHRELEARLKRYITALLLCGSSTIALADDKIQSTKWGIKETETWRGAWDLTPASCNVWTGTGSVSNSANQTVTYKVDVIISGTYVGAKRYQTSDGNDCTFFGELSNSEVSGQYYCRRNGGPYEWSASDVSQPQSICHSTPPVPTNHNWSMKEIPDNDIPGRWELRGATANVWTGKGYLRNPTIAYDLQVIRTENFFAARRTASTDGNNCTYFGNFLTKASGEHIILGPYYCSNSGLVRGHTWAAFPKDIAPIK